jgi:hypothetical protein
MKKIMLAAAFSLASFAVHAADISTKAPSFLPASSPCQVATANTPLSCSGLYVGFGLAGEGSNADIVGNGINGSIFAAGMTPTIDLGYQYAKGNWLFAPEFDIGYAIGSGVSAANNGVGSSGNVNGLRMTEIIKLGGNLAGLLGTQSPITIPPQLAAAVIAPYVGTGATQWQLAGAWANGTIGAAGILFDIGPQWFGDLRYTYTNFNGARAGGLAINDDQSLMFTLNRKF